MDFNFIRNSIAHRIKVIFGNEKKINYLFVSLLLFITVLAYGIFINKIGYFWDDWGFSWMSYNYGNPGLEKYFSFQRPVWGKLYQLTMPILGNHPIRWHIFGIITRWFSALVFWWLLKLIWPEFRSLHAWIVILYIIYPGFRQQLISITYGHFYIIMIVLWFSFGAMVISIRKAGRLNLFHVIGWVGAGLHMFSMEYFVAYELTRPLIMWIEYKRQKIPAKRRINLVIINWFPYLIILGLYLYWRVFILTFQTYQPVLVDNLNYSFGTEVIELLKTVLRDVYITGFYAWVDIFVSLKPIVMTSIRGTINILVMLLSGVAVWFVMNLVRDAETGDNDSINPEKNRVGEIVVFGGVSLLLSGAPFWLTGLSISFNFPADRLTIPMMIPSSILIVSLLHLLFRSKKAINLVLSLVVLFGVGFQYQVSVSYFDDWKRIVSFYNQMIWRAPNLSPGTTIMTPELPINHMSGTSFTTVVNWIYSPGANSEGLSYYLAYIPNRLGDSIPSFEPGFQIFKSYQIKDFFGTTSQVIVILFDPPACMRILDPVYDANSPQIPLKIRDALPLSNPELFVSVEGNNPGELVKNIFGEGTTEDSWCYYFQKADLARQYGDWQKIVALGDVAFNLSDHPNHAVERLPFIEAYARTGDYDRALDLTLETFLINSRTGKILCGVWDRVSHNTAPDERFEDNYKTITQELSCEEK